MRELVVSTFVEKFGESPSVVVRAPGRVNLIGEHTDYNDGFVLPLGIERGVWIALAPDNDRNLDVWSIDFDEAAQFSLDQLERAGPAWCEYVKGTAWALEQAGHQLYGWRGVIASDLPIGAGLSSSAAIELATARAFASASNIPWNPTAMAKHAQRAENEWVGVNCGIMDQMISAVGRDGCAMLIDCRSLAIRPVPIPADTVVVIMDTDTRRGLVDSAYNERRSQCEAAAAFFGVAALRDVTPEMFAARAHELESATARRARHVVTENVRTVAAADALCADDKATVGELMNESHRSLRDDFEVSSPALDTMVAIAQRQPGCHGARMTGAGFGGCAVAFVESEQSASFSTTVAAEYTRQSGLMPRIYVTAACEGATVVEHRGR
jgi:galactokinase